MPFDISQQLITDEIDDHVNFAAALWMQMQMICVYAQSRKRKRGGSLPGKRPNLFRDFPGAHHRIMLDYFLPNSEVRDDGSNEGGPVYNDKYFERRFRMPRVMFERNFSAVVDENDYLRAGLRPDCTGKLGASPLQKVVASLRYIAYGTPADGIDEYCRLGETTTLDSMKAFCRSIVLCFGHHYLRSPTVNDLKRIEKSFSDLGFAGCIGFLDYGKWDWEMCPKGLQGIMNGKEGSPSLRMEVICDMNLHIWHLCFGSPGSMNDLNILSVSPHFANVLAGKFPPCPVSYKVSEEIFDWLYYLTDGIYPRYKIFINTISSPSGRKAQMFAKLQEGVRKSVERVFGVLFKRFGVIRNPSKLWFSEDMLVIMQACCCLHNMLVELRKEWLVGDGISGVRTSVLGGDTVAIETEVNFNRTAQTEEEVISRLNQMASIPADIKSSAKRSRLLNALVDHIADNVSNTYQ